MSKFNIDSQLKRMIQTIKKRAAQKGFEYDLDYPFLKSLYDRQKGKCFLTGIPFHRSWDSSGKEPFLPSVDRKNNDRGYTRDNVMLVCIAVNNAKHVWSLKIFDKIAYNRHEKLVNSQTEFIRIRKDEFIELYSRNEKDVKALKEEMSEMALSYEIKLEKLKEAIKLVEAEEQSANDKREPDRSQLIKAKEVAGILGVTVNKLSDWRYKGIGPDYYKYPTGSVRYRINTVIVWKQSNPPELSH
jgi:hypothetical protein